MWSKSELKFEMLANEPPSKDFVHELITRNDLQSSDTSSQDMDEYQDNVNLDQALKYDIAKEKAEKVRLFLEAEQVRKDTILRKMPK